MDVQDIPAVGELATRVWRAHYPDMISAEQIDYMLQLMYAPNALEKQLSDGQDFWLAEMGGELVGFASLQNIGPQRFFLHKFYVDQDRARTGIGSALMAQLLAHYAPNELQLHVNRKNIKAINFYTKLGFTLDCVVETDIGQGFVMNDFRMKRTS
jgi:GNAT superfamily N-acetyltransferase